MSLNQIPDGWDEGEEEDALEIEELEPPPPPPSYLPSATSMTRSMMKSAYSLGSTTSNAASTAFKSTVAKATNPWPKATSSSLSSSLSSHRRHDHRQEQDNEADDDEEEWAFDDDDLGVDDDDQGKKLAQAFVEEASLELPKPPPPKKSQMTTEEDLLALRNLPPPPSSCPMYHALVDYIQSLTESRDTLLSAMNAILEAEHNTPEAAMELCRYYEARPNLRQYTLETEMPRMSYRLYHAGGGTLDDATEIARYLQNQEATCPFHQELLIRASNQSLLADLLPPLTGPDRLIRPQFLASAVARRCEFVLDLTKNDKSIVHVTAEMLVSVPYHASTKCGRFGLAVVTVGVHFSPGALLQHSVLNVESLLQIPQDLPQLEQVALCLERDVQEIHFDGMPPAHNHESPSISDSMRDYFLSSSYSSEGWQSAWKQIDSVANVTGKFGFLRNMMTLPTMDDLREAEQEETKWKKDTQRASSSSRGLFDRLAGDAPPPPPTPPPPPPAQLPEDDDPASRPAPILGGLLMSGLTRLAKSAALPDVHAEEEAYAAQRRQQLLDRQRQDNWQPTETITLYRTQDEDTSRNDNDDRTLEQSRDLPSNKNAPTQTSSKTMPVSSNKTTTTSSSSSNNTPWRAPTKVIKTSTSTTAPATTSSNNKKTVKPTSISSRMSSAARSAMSGVSSTTASLTGSTTSSSGKTKKSSSFLTATTSTTASGIETELETVTFGGGGENDINDEEIPLALQTSPGDAYQFYLGEKDTADGVVVVMEEQPTTSTRSRWYPKGLRFPVY